MAFTIYCRTLSTKETFDLQVIQLKPCKFNKHMTVIVLSHMTTWPGQTTANVVLHHRSRALTAHLIICHFFLFLSKQAKQNPKTITDRMVLCVVNRLILFKSAGRSRCASSSYVSRARNV